jgi:hypothetical protein
MNILCRQLPGAVLITAQEQAGLASGVIIRLTATAVASTAT